MMSMESGLLQGSNTRRKARNAHAYRFPSTATAGGTVTAATTTATVIATDNATVTATTTTTTTVTTTARLPVARAFNPRVSRV